MLHVLTVPPFLHSICVEFFSNFAPIVISANLKAQSDPTRLPPSGWSFSGRYPCAIVVGCLPSCDRARLFSLLSRWSFKLIVVTLLWLLLIAFFVLPLHTLQPSSSLSLLAPPPIAFNSSLARRVPSLNKTISQSLLIHQYKSPCHSYPFLSHQLVTESS